MTTEPQSERDRPARSAVEPGMGGTQWSRSEMQHRLEKREAMLGATSFAAAQFLAVPWQKSLDAALRALGEALDVSRVWVVEQRADSPDPPREWQWVRPASPALNQSNNQNNGATHNTNGAANGKPNGEGKRGKNVWDERDWHLITASGAAVQLCISAQTSEQKKVALENGDLESEVLKTNSARIADEFLRARGALALAAAPVGVEKEVWGHIGFDECRAPRAWDDSEIEVLQILADIIGVAIARDHSDAALRESETELRALLGAMRDVILVLDSEGRYLKIFANDATILFMPLDQMIGQTLETVLGAETGRRFLAVIGEVLSTRSLRAFEYSLPIDGEEFWFSASVTPLGESTVLWVARDVTEGHRARESLRESEALFRLLAENSTDKIARLSLNGSFLYVSPSVQPLLGYTPDEMVGTVPMQMVHPDDRFIVVESFKRIQATPGITDIIVYRMRRSDGQYIWFETTARLVPEQNGQSGEIHSVSRDVSERRAGEEALRQAENKYRSIFENAVEGIFQTTPDGHYLDANPALARIYGYDSLEEMQHRLVDISQQLYTDPRRRLDFIAEMEENGFVSSFESQVQRKDGQVIWVSENARAVRGETGALLYYEGTVEDITARKTAEEQLLHDAFHDKLTGLSNRALFMDRLSLSLARLKRHPEAPFATLFLDFDRFKNVNDSLGHFAGDQLLIAVSGRINECLRPGDTISRLGGDEFAILLADVGDVAGAIKVAERIQSAMSAPFHLLGQEIFTSASIGIAMGDTEYAQPEELLRDADMAMYRAKALGKARHHVFDAGMHQRAVALLQLETDLRHAIERGEFRVAYQPIVTLQSGRIAGFEALVRWQHPTRGVIPPADFIPIAEETGWIVPIGRYVLEAACQQLAQWHRTLGDDSLSMSVNLSSKQFAQADLGPEIKAVLRRHGLPPQCLKLEITESALMERAEEITERLLELRDLGVKLGLDDFGTGYSSLSYLHSFPLDTLKIDRSFIARMSQGESGGEENREHHEIVRTIVALGKNLGMNVVAEGVEDALQLAELRQLRCNSGQGYFFARPLSAGDALQLLQRAPVW